MSVNMCYWFSLINSGTPFYIYIYIVSSVKYNNKMCITTIYVFEKLVSLVTTKKFLVV